RTVRSWSGRPRRTATSSWASRTRTRSLPTRLHDPAKGLPVPLHGRPGAVAVEAVDVELGLLPGAARHHRPALVVDVEHQPGGLLPVVAEKLLARAHDV